MTKGTNYIYGMVILCTIEQKGYDIMKPFEIEDLYWYYRETRHDRTEEPLYGYDIDKEKFIKLTDTVKEKMEKGIISVIPFINAYKVCLEIIDMYLERDNMKEYKAGARQAMKQKRHDKIVAFLWYFEHIDGCYPFEEFEEVIVKKELVKWCKRNGFEYILS